VAHARTTRRAARGGGRLSLSPLPLQSVGRGRAQLTAAGGVAVVRR
jgi:hypothetical protein